VKIPHALEITDGKFICRPMYPSDRTTKSFSKTQYLIRIIYRQWRGSAVNEPSTLQVRKSSSQVTRMQFFPQTKLVTFFSCRRRQRRFTVKIKQIKLSDMATFLFSVCTITEAKQYVRLGRAEPGLESRR